MHVHEHTYSYDSISINQYIKKCEYEKKTETTKQTACIPYTIVYLYSLTPFQCQDTPPPRDGRGSRYDTALRAVRAPSDPFFRLPVTGLPSSSLQGRLPSGSQT